MMAKMHVRFTMRARMHPARFDAWLAAVFVCVATMIILLVGLLLGWSIPWWIYAIVFSACLLMPLWVVWRYRHGWRP